MPVHQGIVLLRAIACLAILIIHTYSATGPLEAQLATSLNQLLRFGAPALIFVSSYLMFASRPGRRRFVMNRVRYVIVPFLLVSIGPIVGHLAQHHPWKAVSQLITGGGTHLFFVPVLLQIYLGYLLVERLPRVDWQRWIWPSTGLALGWSAFLMALNVPVNQWQWLIPSWTPFVVLGAVHATDPTWVLRLWDRWGRWLGFALAAMALVVSLQLFWFPAGQPIRVEILSTSRGPTILVYSLLVIIWWMSHRVGEPTVRVPIQLGWFSRHSFGIYLVHPFVAQALSLAIGSAAWPGPARPAVVAALSLLLVAVVRAIPGGTYVLGKPGPLGASDLSPGRGSMRPGETERGASDPAESHLAPRRPRPGPLLPTARQIDS